MKFFNLGKPSNPCAVLKWRGLTIMLDCSLDLSSVINFLPLPLSGSSKFHSTPRYQNGRNVEEKELCDLNGQILIDTNPLFGVPFESSIEVSDIDVILISNSSSILALPYFTENPEFHGNVYATEPTVNIGKFLMEELVGFVNNAPKGYDKSVEQSIYTLLNSTLNFPVKDSASNLRRNFKPIYSNKAISEAMLKIKIIGFNENTDVYGKITAIAVSSGYSLGSCNWVLKSGKKKFVYVTSSSTLTTHPSPMEQTPLKDADVFILTGLTQAPGQNPDAMLGEICMSVVNTLRTGGNVIFPCYPSGIIYDLFECLGNHLDTNGLNAPFYFISPHAESSLAYSNILAEWLSSTKQKKVYLPEDPFPHAHMVKDGRLKHFKALHKISELKQPAIIFCGHPSLRFGDVVHLVETFGSNPSNTMICTVAEFPHIECISAYHPLGMKVIFCPIDTSLNFSQANKLIKDLKPVLLITNEEYLTPPKSHPNWTECVIEYPNIKTIYPGSVTQVKLKREDIEAHMDSILASEIDPTHQPDAGVYAATITATLDSLNNKYRLVKPSMDLCDPWKCPPTKYAWGAVDPNILLQNIAAEGFGPSKLQYTNSGFTISLPSENVLVTVESGSTHISCKNSDGGIRLKLRRMITSCLSEF